MVKIRKITKLDTDEIVLRKKNEELIFPLSREIKQLIEDMKVTVQKAPGIGLAAPQVGENVKLAIINLPELGAAPFGLINPKVVSKSIKKTEMDEGCLSIPGKFMKVRRPARVEVAALSESGKTVHFKADGLFAKVLQHEIDHLNAILIVDRA